MAKGTNKEKILSALLESSSITEAAKKCGLAEKTVYRYLEDKDFLTEYRNARRRIVENAVSQLQSIAGDAVTALKKNLSCGNPQAEIRAAQIVLDGAVKGVEMVDILERLEALEDAHQKQNQKDGNGK